MSTTHPAAAPSAPSLPSRRGVVLPSVDRAVAARLVQVLGSGGWLVPWPDGGTVVTGDVVAAAALARVLSDEVAGRSAVVLWADPDVADAEETDADTDLDAETVGPVAGFVVAHRGQVATAHSWTTDGAGEEADAHVLAVALGRPDLEVGVRALLRRPSPDPQAALTEFVDLLGLPRGAVPLLSAAELPPSTEYVPPATGRRRLAAFRSTVAAQPEPGWAGPLRRWQFLLPGTVAAWFAARAVLAGATDGPPEDAWGFGALALVASGATVWRARRDRRAPAADADRP